MCVKVLLAKKLPYVPTVDDLIALEKGDLDATGGRNSRLKMLEQAVRRAVAANVPIVFGSGATSEHIPHGRQADQFAYYAKWGMGPVKTLQTRCALVVRLQSAVTLPSRHGLAMLEQPASQARRPALPAPVRGASRSSAGRQLDSHLIRQTTKGYVERGLGPAVRAARHLSAGVGG